jgi:heme exporter protein C
MWSFFHKLGSPRWFYGISGKWLPWLTLGALALLGGGCIWGLLFTPPDYLQGDSYRIIYIHVPASIIAQSGYFTMAVAGAIFLIWRMKVAEIAMKCAAPIGAAMTFVSLVTGSIWGKPTWGTWWVWDARITSMLILLFLYLGVIALYEAFENKQAAAKACAILSLVGTVDIPLVKYSVYFWNTLHQPPSLKLTEKSTIDPSMLYPLLMTIFGMYCFYVLALFLNMRAEILERERTTQWVRELIARRGRPNAV